MTEFLQRGVLGPIGIGTPMADVLRILGDPSDTGVNLPRGFRLHAYAGRRLQITYLDGIVFLIGIYFRPKDSRPPVLPAALGVEVPFTGATTRAEFIAYLDAHAIRCTQHPTLPDALRLGAASAYFDDACLCSLHAS